MDMLRVRPIWGWRTPPEAHLPPPLSILISNPLTFKLTSAALTSGSGTPRLRTPASLVYFQTYLNITYFLCLSPFTISYSDFSNSFEIRKSKFQNVVCGIIQFFVLFQFLSHSRGLDTKLLQVDPSNYFEVAIVLGTVVYYLILFPTLWTRQSEILNIFNLVANNFSKHSSRNPNSNNNEEYYNYNNGSARSQLQAFMVGPLHIVRIYIRPVIVCSLSLGWALYSVITGMVAVKKYFILAIPTDYASRAEFVYMFRTHDCSSVLNVSLNISHEPGIFQAHSHGGPLLQALTVWYIFVEFYIWLASYYCDLLVLLSGIFVRRIVRDFVSILHRQDATPQLAVQQFLMLKSIVQQLNKTMGPLVLAVVVASLPYCASNLETVLAVTTDGVRRLRLLFYCLVFFASLVIAADGNTRISQFKDWLMDEGRSSGVPHSLLVLVINELNSFGLKGHEFFTITYGFFGTILSVLLTYSFIIVQIHSSTNSTQPV